MTGTGAADLAEVARAPIVGAQRPAGLKRPRHHLLDPLAADRMAEERGAEQAMGQAGDEGRSLSSISVSCYFCFDCRTLATPAPNLGCFYRCLLFRR